MPRLRRPCSSLQAHATPRRLAARRRVTGPAQPDAASVTGGGAAWGGAATVKEGGGAVWVTRGGGGQAVEYVGRQRGADDGVFRVNFLALAAQLRAAARPEPA